MHPNLKATSIFKNCLVQNSHHLDSILTRASRPLWGLHDPTCATIQNLLKCTQDAETRRQAFFFFSLSFALSIFCFLFLALRIPIGRVPLLHVHLFSATLMDLVSRVGRTQLFLSSRSNSIQSLPAYSVIGVDEIFLDKFSVICLQVTCLHVTLTLRIASMLSVL